MRPLFTGRLILKGFRQIPRVDRPKREKRKITDPETDKELSDKDLFYPKIEGRIPRPLYAAVKEICETFNYTWDEFITSRQGRAADHGDDHAAVIGDYIEGKGGMHKIAETHG